MAASISKQNLSKKFFNELEAELFDGAHKIEIVLLSLLLGVLTTQLFISIFFNGRAVARSLISSAYQIAWIVVPAGTIVILLLLAIIKNLVIRDDERFYPLSLLLNSLTVSVTICNPNSFTIFHRVLLIFIPQFITLAWLLLLRRNESSIWWKQNKEIISSLILGTLLIQYLFIFLTSNAETPLITEILCYGIIGFYLIQGIMLDLRVLPLDKMTTKAIKGPVEKKPVSWSIAQKGSIFKSRAFIAVKWAVLVLLIASVVFDPLFFMSDFVRHHQNFFLGVINEIRGGKDVLINTYSQYGLFQPYLLSIILGTGLIPFTYEGFSLFISILFVFQYSLVYFIVEKISPYKCIPLLVTAVVLFFNFFSTEWFTLVSVPASGPLRYLGPYLILTLEILKGQQITQPRKQKITSLVEYALVGLSAIWSAESALYVLFTFLTCNTFTLFAEDGKWAPKIQHFLKFLGKTVLSIALVWLAFLLLIYLRGNKLPEIGAFINYLSFLTAYVYTDFNYFYDVPLKYLFSFWVIGPAIYFGSFIVCVYVFFSKRQELIRKYSIIAGLTVFGILQFSYFFVYARDILFVVVSVPIIMLAFFWLSEAYQHQISVPVRLVVISAYLIITILFFVLRLPFSTQERWQHTLLAYSINQAEQLLAGKPIQNSIYSTYYEYKPTNQATDEAEQLIDKYFAGKQRVTIFISPEDEVETFFHTGKTNVYPVSHPYLIEVVPEIKAQVESLPNLLQPHERILVLNDETKIAPVDRHLLGTIRNECTLLAIYSSETYTVYEVQ